MNRHYSVIVSMTLNIEAPTPDDAQDKAWDIAKWELGCQDEHDWFITVENKVTE